MCRSDVGFRPNTERVEMWSRGVDDWYCVTRELPLLWALLESEVGRTDLKVLNQETVNSRCVGTRSKDTELKE